MAISEQKKNGPAPFKDDSVKRRGLLRFGTLITAFTGASTISAIYGDKAHAAPGDKTPTTTYVPTAEKGAASGVATLDAQSKIPSAQLPDLSSTYARKTHVTVGPTGDYLTIAEALTSFPNGSVDIELQTGVINEPGLLPITALMKFVTLRGQGRSATRVLTPAGLIDAPKNADGWCIKDFSLECTTATNTVDGIKADYPRRWNVTGLGISGFGGTSLWYCGGIHSRMEFNYALAKDPANINGFAGFRCDKSSAGVVSTAFSSQQNYVGSGKKYGFYFEQTNVGTVFEQDTAELCDIGMRFAQCSGELRSPYTEANRIAAIEMHDSNLVMSGRFRDLPAMTWASVAAADRFPVYTGPASINPGKAIIFAPGTSPAVDANTNVSIRSTTMSPNGVLVGVPGSIVIRALASGGRVLYVKESGTGNTGWSPYGTQTRTTAELISATSSANTPDKYLGQCIFNTTTGRPVWASGAAPTSPWVYADGTTAHTPA